MHTQTTVYELKYCERCGSLGLRRVCSGETYCRPCGHALTNVVLPGHRSPLKLSAVRCPVDGGIAPLVFLGEAQLDLGLRRRP